MVLKGKIYLKKLILILFILTLLFIPASAKQDVIAQNDTIVKSLQLIKQEAPQEYKFIIIYLDWVQYSEFEVPGVFAYVCPGEQFPTCYIVNRNLKGIDLASVIAHEAWHMYEYKNHIDTGEIGAWIYAARIAKLLQ